MSYNIVVTTDSNDGFRSALDPRFGRAPYYVFVDHETGEIIQQMENTGADSAQGAGTVAAALMAGQKVQAAISGRFGPKAYTALEKLGIEMWIAPEGMSLRQVLKRYSEGMLEQMKIKVYE